MSMAKRRRPERPSFDAFEGCVLGLAIGDALGFPAEFRRREQILAAFPPDGITGFVAVHDPAWPPRPIIFGAQHPPGTFTDDTQMSVAVAEGLLDAGRADLDTLMAAVGRRFVRWSRSADNDRAPGATCMAGCDRLAAGVAWREAGVAGSKGCGSAMRAAPIGLYYCHDRARLLEVARASSLPTHGHDAAVEGAAAAALLVQMALQRRPPEEMYAALAEECAPRSADFAACLGRLPGLLAAEPAVALSQAGLGEAWVAEEAIASALYCFSRSPGDYVRTVLTAVNTDGDSDSIGCIAGSISGAYNGAAAIPAAWRAEVEDAEVLQALARRLWEAA